MLTLAATAIAILPMNAKKVLSHEDFDNWKSVRVECLSNDGQWAAYAVNPQEGDGILTLRNTKTGKQVELPRGYKPMFSADGKYAVAQIKPLFQDTRKAKIDGKKKFDLPQDSLAIIWLQSGKVEKIPNVTSYAMGRKGGSWIAYATCDTSFISPKNLKDKVGSKPLIIRNLATPNARHKMIDRVKGYSFSPLGNVLALNINKLSTDTIGVDGVALMLLPDTNIQWLDTAQYWFSLPVFNENGSMAAYTMSNDSTDTGTKKAQLRLARITTRDISVEDVYLPKTKNAGKFPNLMPPPITDPSKRDSIMKAMHDRVAAMAGDSLFLNQYSTVCFSRDGKRLVTGIAPAIAPDDTTIVDFEQAQLDIWRWDAPMTPPQENHEVDKLRKKTFPVVVNLESGKSELLYTEPLATVEAPDRWDADWALVHDPSENIISQQWNYLADEKLLIVNVNNGMRTEVGTAPVEMSELSPAGNYVWWFNNRNYFTYNIATGETVNVTQDMEYPVWDEDQDTPMQRMPYGTAGWLDNDEALLVYDRHDIWQLDPTGKTKPVCLTNGEGRRQNRRYHYMNVNPDPDKRSISKGEEVLLSLFDYTDKRHGFATIKIGKPVNPTIRTLEKNTFTQVRRAKDAPVYAFQKSNFSTSPNVYIALNNDFAKAKKVTDANPQMKEYNWGTAELVKWYAYNGDLTEGVLYKPEDFDPTKKYPMLTVFYETNSEELYRHYTMEPSWSWVNYPFYVSRGYVVFVPDVHYFPGIPAEGAYNYICSGVEDLCNKYEWIDRDRLGIDGQSWGGYQTAYLITRTNMFACAGSGAPVANMTSAFGGIRWESGSSRQAQYEMGQSRIGRNLWDARDLYVANSPVFYADRVNTPLLIMHNDADGAVPWYQGIEYFMALRRLGKPVWMLQYNGEAHNIRARKNRKDITIRLQQFFDHYLKGDPMPRWMKDGIPAIRKGQEMRTELVE